MLTSEEFGSQGDLTHPELLDWLAVEFVDSDWDIKHMLRLMVTSRPIVRAWISSIPATKRILPTDGSGGGSVCVFLPSQIRRPSPFCQWFAEEKILGPSVNPPQPKMGLNAAFGSQIDWKQVKERIVTVGALYHMAPIQSLSLHGGL